MATMNVEIVAPEAALWTGPASALVARSSEGDFTILAQHTSTVGDIVSSIVRVETDEGPIAFAVHSGFFQVGPGLEPDTTLATVLASVAERTTDIDVARAQAAKDTAQDATLRRPEGRRRRRCTDCLRCARARGVAAARRLRKVASAPTRSRADNACRARVRRASPSRRHRSRPGL